MHLTRDPAVSDQRTGLRRRDCTSGWAVGEARIPLFAAALRGEVEQIPEGPDHIDVAAVLARVTGG